jgi:four helix bundle protein
LENGDAAALGLCQCAGVQNYKKLKAWSKGHALLMNIHRELRSFPREYSSLRSQLRRAAESIVFNIVEGCGFVSQKEFAKYLQSSISSANEVEYELQCAHEYGILPKRRWEALAEDTAEVRRVTVGLLKQVKAEIDRDEQSADS